MNTSPPKALLAFNEPDISGQSNLDPTTAANLWMQEIQPWKKRGVRLGSPQIVWNQDWLSQFMNICKSKGCTVGKYTFPRGEMAIVLWPTGVGEHAT